MGSGIAMRSSMEKHRFFTLISFFNDSINGLISFRRALLLRSTQSLTSFRIEAFPVGIAKFRTELFVDCSGEAFVFSGIKGVYRGCSICGRVVGTLIEELRYLVVICLLGVKYEAYWV